MKQKPCVSSGSGTLKSFTTTSLNNHLSYKHPEEYKQVVNKRTAAATPSRGYQQTGANQQTLADVIGKKKMWSINSAEARKIHHAIGKMIAVLQHLLDISMVYIDLK